MSFRLSLPGSPRARLQHLVFWLVFAVLMLISIVRAPGPALGFGEVVIRLLILIVMTAAASYVNLGGLVPRLLLAKRYVAYGFAVVGVVFLTAFGIGLAYAELLQVRGETASAEVVGGAGYESENLARRLPGQGASIDGERGPNLTRLTSIFAVHTLIWVGATSLLHFGLGWVRNQDLERRRLEAELTALKAQLNPYFLFNALNNLYGLAMNKSDFAPSYVLKLGELMRYVVHDSQASRVSLRKELGFVRNYFDLEKARAAGRLVTVIEIGEGVEDRKIAPLLLLPLVENAFKYGTTLQTAEAKVEFHAQMAADDRLEIRICNNRDPAEISPVEVGFVGAPGGVGLANVRRRLELLYPDRHQLQIRDQGSRFEVSLRLDTRE